MSDARDSDPFAEIINLLAAPVAGGIRQVEQMKRGVDEMWRAVDNLNTTMESLNETATRINVLLEELEEPIRAMIPQLTRTIKTADEITQKLEGPVRAAAPNIEQIAQTLSAPGFANLPAQLSEVLTSVGDVSKRLAPLTAFAENAGGLFGGLRLPGMPGAPKPADAPAKTAAPSPEPADTKPAVKKRAAKKVSTKKAPAKKRAAKKSAAKKSAAKKTS